MTQRFMPSSSAIVMDAYGVSALGPATGMIVTETMEGQTGWKKHVITVSVGVATGLTVSILAAVLVPWVKKKLGIEEAK